MSAVTLQRLVGNELLPHLPDIARLRIAVFREYPYLYDGDEAYEHAYLRALAQSPASVCAVVLDHGQVVGASTGLPLAEADPLFAAPFVAGGYDIARIFYLAESVLLPDYRGRGWGRRFFVEREAHARALNTFDTAAFCAVERPATHPQRPANYQPLDAFWQRCGYQRSPELHTSYHWKDLGEADETSKTMVFWVKAL
jgi:GNAT superfamily N-acetyltransferase